MPAQVASQGLFAPLHRHQSALRLVAVLLAYAFLWPHLAWAFEAPALSAANLPGLVLNHKPMALPKSLGTVRQVRQGNGKRIVVVQDLHCHYELQMNIAQLLGLLAREYGIRLVGVEGAFQTVNAARLRQFPDASSREAVCAYLVRQGKLSGAEWAAAMGQAPLRLEGVETPALYEKSLAAVKTFLNDESLNTCEDIRHHFESMEKQGCSQAWLAWQEAVRSFQSGQIDLLRFCLLACETARQAGLDPNDYPGVEAYSRALVSGADLDGLQPELERLERAVSGRLAATGRERQLVEVTRRLEIVQRLLNISATPEDLAEYRAAPPAFSARAFLQSAVALGAEENNGWSREFSAWDDYLLQAARFYELADVRSREFVKNFEAKMDRQGVQDAVLVIGSFHTQGVLAALAADRTSYALVVPRMTRLDLVNPYFNLLAGNKTPLEKLLERSAVLLALRTQLPDVSFSPEKVVPRVQMGSKTAEVFAGLSESLMEQWWISRLARKGLSPQVIERTCRAELVKVYGQEAGSGVLGYGNLGSDNPEMKNVPGAGRTFVVIPTRLELNGEPLKVLAQWGRTQPLKLSDGRPPVDQMTIDGVQFSLLPEAQARLASEKLSQPARWAQWALAFNRAWNRWQQALSRTGDNLHRAFTGRKSLLPEDWPRIQQQMPERLREQLPRGFNPGQKVRVKGVVLDIDATVAPDDKSRPAPENLAQIVRALRRHIPVLLISGSPVRSLIPTKIYRGEAPGDYEEVFQDAGPLALGTRIIPDLVRAMLAAGEPEALQFLTVKGQHGVETLTFDAQGRQQLHLRQDLALSPQEQREYTRAMAIGHLRAWARARGVASPEAGVAAAVNFRGIQDQYKAALRSLGVTGRIFLSEAEEELLDLCDEHPLPGTPLIRGYDVLKETLNYLNERGLHPEEDGMVFSAGDTFAKFYRLRKSTEARAWCGALPGEGAVLGAGDSRIDDFLWQPPAEKLFFGFYLGRAEEVSEVSGLIVARDSRGRDLQKHQATAPALRHFLDAQDQGRTYAEVPFLDNQFALADFARPSWARWRAWLQTGMPFGPAGAWGQAGLALGRVRALGTVSLRRWPWLPGLLLLLLPGLSWLLQASTGMYLPAGGMSAPVFMAAAGLVAVQPSTKLSALEQLRHRLLAESDSGVEDPEKLNLAVVTATFWDDRTLAAELAAAVQRLAGAKQAFTPDLPLTEQLQAAHLSWSAVQGLLCLCRPLSPSERLRMPLVSARLLELEAHLGSRFFTLEDDEFWTFSRAIQLHWPWYAGYNFYGDKGAERLLGLHRLHEPELVNDPAWWQARWEEYAAQQARWERSAFQGHLPEWRAEGVAAFQKFAPMWNTAQRDAWQRFLGFDPAKEALQPRFGLNGLGSTSSEWWQALHQDLLRGFMARQNLADEDEKKAWQDAARLCQRIAKGVRDRREAELVGGRWWVRIFESLNTQAYRSLEWWSRSWPQLNSAELPPAEKARLREQALQAQRDLARRVPGGQGPLLRQAMAFFRTHFNQGKLERFIRDYEQDIQVDLNYDAFYARRAEFLGFLERELLPQTSEGLRAAFSGEWLQKRESLTDMLGALRVLALRRQDKETCERTDRVARILFRVPSERLNYKDFEAFLEGSQKRLRAAVAANQPVVFVMGHSNPDTDAVVTSLVEAFRQHLLNGEAAAYIPVVRGHQIPDVVRYMLGNAIADGLLLSAGEYYQKFIQHPRSFNAHWILVDHSRPKPEIADRILAVLDHHPLQAEVQNGQTVLSWYPICSAAGIEAQKLSALGAEVPPQFALLLYNAMLADTKGRLSSAMGRHPWNPIIMDAFQNLAGVRDVAYPEQYYSKVMAVKLKETEARILLERDYKKDWTFGWAKVEAKGVFTPDGRIANQELLNKLAELEWEKLGEHPEHPLVLVSVVSYQADNVTVDRERILFFFRPEATDAFRRKVLAQTEAQLRALYADNPDYPHYTLQKGKQASADRQGHEWPLPYLEVSGTYEATARNFLAPDLENFIQTEFIETGKPLTRDDREAAPAQGNRATRSLAQGELFSPLALNSFAWPLLLGMAPWRGAAAWFQAGSGMPGWGLTVFLTVLMLAQPALRRWLHGRLESLRLALGNWQQQAGRSLLAAWGRAPKSVRTLAGSFFLGLAVQAADLEQYRGGGTFQQELKVAQDYFERHPGESGIPVFGGARLKPGTEAYEKVVVLGRVLAEAGFPVWTGSGPGAMEAAPKGAAQVAGHKPIGGSKINLPYFNAEQGVNPYMEVITHHDFFQPRKLVLTHRIPAAVVVPGGFGTDDELFEVLRQNVPVVLWGSEYWQPVLEPLYAHLVATGAWDPKLFRKPLVTDSGAEAVAFIRGQMQLPHQGVSADADAIRRMRQDAAAGENALAAWKPGWVVAGGELMSPEQQSEAGRLLQKLGRIETLRSVDQGSLPWTRQAGQGRDQALLLLEPAERTPVQMRALPRRSLAVSDGTVHRYLLNQKTRGYVFLPGKLGKLNIFFDTLTQMQCHKIPQRPIILVGRSFWEPVMQILTEHPLQHAPPLISPWDPHLVTIVDSVEEAQAALGDDQALLGGLAISRTEARELAAEPRLDTPGFPGLHFSRALAVQYLAQARADCQELIASHPGLGPVWKRLTLLEQQAREGSLRQAWEATRAAAQLMENLQTGLKELAAPTGFRAWKPLPWAWNLARAPLGMIGWIGEKIEPWLAQRKVSDRWVALLSGFEELIFSGLLISGLGWLFSFVPLLGGVATGLTLGWVLSAGVFTWLHRHRVFYLVQGKLVSAPPQWTDLAALGIFGSGLRAFYLALLLALPFGVFNIAVVLPAVILLHGLYSAVLAPLLHLPLGRLWYQFQFNAPANGDGALTWLGPKAELAKVEKFRAQLLQEVAEPGSGALPKVVVFSDVHGSLETLDELLLHALRDTAPPQTKLPKKINPDATLAAQGINLKAWQGRVFFENLGDLFDKNTSGLVAAARVMELTEAGVGESILGNHDLYVLMNLSGLHLPSYAGFEFYGYRDRYGDVASLWAEKFRSDPQTRQQRWWAEKLAEYQDRQRVLQKHWREAREALAKYEDAEDPDWRDLFFALEFVGCVSIGTWRTLLKRFEQRAKQEDRKRFAKVVNLIRDEILPSREAELNEQVKAGNWWCRVFDAINDGFQRTPEWKAQEWMLRDDYGRLALEEANRIRGPGEPAVTAGNYLANPRFQKVGAFFRKRFQLFSRDLFQNTYLHSVLPVDPKTSEFMFSYRGVEYRGRGSANTPSVWEGLRRIERDFRNPRATLPDLREAFTLFNQWYLAGTTRTKASDVARLIRTPERLETFSEANGFNRLFTGHVPITKYLRLEEKQRGQIEGFQIGERFFDVDHAMPKGGGAAVHLDRSGVHLHGFEFGEKELKLQPKTFDPKGKSEVVFDNQGIPGERFVYSVLHDTEARIRELQDQLGIRTPIRRQPQRQPAWLPGGREEALAGSMAFTGSMPWLRQWFQARGVSAQTYDRAIAWWLENLGAFTLSALVFGLPLWLATGNPLFVFQFSYLATWPVFVAAHGWEKAANSLPPGPRLLVLGIAAASCSLLLAFPAMPAAVLAGSFLIHALANWAGAWFFQENETAVDFGQPVWRRLTWLDRVPALRAWLLSVSALLLAGRLRETTARVSPLMSSETLPASPRAQQFLRAYFSPTGFDAARFRAGQVRLAVSNRRTALWFGELTWDEQQQPSVAMPEILLRAILGQLPPEVTPATAAWLRWQAARILEYQSGRFLEKQRRQYADRENKPMPGSERPDARALARNWKLMAVLSGAAAAVLAPFALMLSSQTPSFLGLVTMALGAVSFWKNYRDSSWRQRLHQLIRIMPHAALTPLLALSPDGRLPFEQLEQEWEDRSVKSLARGSGGFGLFHRGRQERPMRRITHGVELENGLVLPLSINYGDLDPASALQADWESRKTPGMVLKTRQIGLDPITFLGVLGPAGPLTQAFERQLVFSGIGWKHMVHDHLLYVLKGDTVEVFFNNQTVADAKQSRKATELLRAVKEQLANEAETAARRQALLAELRGQAFFGPLAQTPATDFPALAAEALPNGRLVIAGRLEFSEAESIAKALRQRWPGSWNALGNIILFVTAKGAVAMAEHPEAGALAEIQNLAEGMLTVVDFSDTHIADKGREDNFGSVKEAELSQLVARAAARGSLIIINGDFLELWKTKYGGIRRNYDELFTLLRQARRVVYVAGNHDEDILANVDNKHRRKLLKIAKAQVVSEDGAQQEAFRFLITACPAFSVGKVRLSRGFPEAGLVRENGVGDWFVDESILEIAQSQGTAAAVSRLAKLKEDWTQHLGDLVAEDLGAEIVQYYLDEVRGLYFEHGHISDPYNYQSRTGRMVASTVGMLERWGWTTAENDLTQIGSRLSQWIPIAGIKETALILQRVLALAGILRETRAREPLTIFFGHTHQPITANLRGINTFTHELYQADYVNSGTWSSMGKRQYMVPRSVKRTWQAEAGLPEDKRDQALSVPRDDHRDWFLISPDGRVEFKKGIAGLKFIAGIFQPWYRAYPRLTKFVISPLGEGAVLTLFSFLALLGGFPVLALGIALASAALLAFYGHRQVLIAITGQDKREVVGGKRVQRAADGSRYYQRPATIWERAWLFVHFAGMSLLPVLITMAFQPQLGTGLGMAAGWLLSVLGHGFLNAGEKAAVSDSPSASLKYSAFFEPGRVEGPANLTSRLHDKGGRLAEMCRLNLPVPPGFTLAPDISLAMNREGLIPRAVEREIAANLRHLNRATGLVFGDPTNPLLVSVRSGAEVSMPGLMKTVTTLGLNDQTVQGLAGMVHNEVFAYRKYAEFIAEYGTAVMGAEEKLFSDQYRLWNEKLAARPPTVADWQRLIEAYQEQVQESTGRAFPQDVGEQLQGAILAVAGSWDDPAVRDYRTRKGVPDLGTGVTIQKMVFGDRDFSSGAGVVYSRDLYTGERKLTGNFESGQIGQRIVSGQIVPAGIQTLQEKFPQIYGALAKDAGVLENRFKEIQDIEFILENGKLYLLQSRDAGSMVFPVARVQSYLEMLRDGQLTQEEIVRDRMDLEELYWAEYHFLAPRIADPTAVPLAWGMPAAPGIGSGKAVFSLSKAAELSARGESFVLVREKSGSRDESTLNVQACAGSVELRGSPWAHAPSLLRRDRNFKPAIVAVKGPAEFDSTGGRTWLRLGGTQIQEGALLTLDGSSGAIYAGQPAFQESPLYQKEYRPHLQTSLSEADTRLWEFYGQVQTWKKIYEAQYAQEEQDFDSLAARYLAGENLPDLTLETRTVLETIRRTAHSLPAAPDAGALFLALKLSLLYDRDMRVKHAQYLNRAKELILATEPLRLARALALLLAARPEVIATLFDQENIFKTHDKLRAVFQDFNQEPALSARLLDLLLPNLAAMSGRELEQYGKQMHFVLTDSLPYNEKLQPILEQLSPETLANLAVEWMLRSETRSANAKSLGTEPAVYRLWGMPLRWVLRKWRDQDPEKYAAFWLQLDRAQAASGQDKNWLGRLEAVQIQPQPDSAGGQAIAMVFQPLYHDYPRLTAFVIAPLAEGLGLAALSYLALLAGAPPLALGLALATAAVLAFKAHRTILIAVTPQDARFRIDGNLVFKASDGSRYYRRAATWRERWVLFAHFAGMSLLAVLITRATLHKLGPWEAMLAGLLPGLIWHPVKNAYERSHVNLREVYLKLKSLLLAWRSGLRAPPESGVAVAFRQTIPTVSEPEIKQIIPMKNLKQIWLGIGVGAGLLSLGSALLAIPGAAAACLAFWKPIEPLAMSAAAGGFVCGLVDMIGQGLSNARVFKWRQALVAGLLGSTFGLQMQVLYNFIDWAAPASGWGFSGLGAGRVLRVLQAWNVGWVRSVLSLGTALLSLEYWFVIHFFTKGFSTPAKNDFRKILDFLLASVPLQLLFNYILQNDIALTIRLAGVVLPLRVLLTLALDTLIDIPESWALNQSHPLRTYLRRGVLRAIHQARLLPGGGRSAWRAGVEGLNSMDRAQRRAAFITLLKTQNFDGLYPLLEDSRSWARSQAALLLVELALQKNKPEFTRECLAMVSASLPGEEDWIASEAKVQAMVRLGGEVKDAPRLFRKWHPNQTEKVTSVLRALIGKMKSDGYQVVRILASNRSYATKTWMPGHDVDSLHVCCQEALAPEAAANYQRWLEAELAALGSELHMQGELKDVFIAGGGLDLINQPIAAGSQAQYVSVFESDRFIFYERKPGERVPAKHAMRKRLFDAWRDLKKSEPKEVYLTPKQKWLVQRLQGMLSLRFLFDASELFLTRWERSHLQALQRKGLIELAGGAEAGQTAVKLKWNEPETVEGVMLSAEAAEHWWELAPQPLGKQLRVPYTSSLATLPAEVKVSVVTREKGELIQAVALPAGSKSGELSLDTEKIMGGMVTEIRLAYQRPAGVARATLKFGPFWSNRNLLPKGWFYIRQIGESDLPAASVRGSWAQTFSGWVSAPRHALPGLHLRISDFDPRWQAVRAKLGLPDPETAFQQGLQPVRFRNLSELGPEAAWWTPQHWLGAFFQAEPGSAWATCYLPDAVLKAALQPRAAGWSGRGREQARWLLLRFLFRHLTGKSYGPVPGGSWNGKPLQLPPKPSRSFSPRA